MTEISLVYINMFIIQKTKSDCKEFSVCVEISLLGDHFNWFVGPKIMF